MMMTTPSRIKPPLAAGLNRASGLADRLAGAWLLSEGTGQVVHDFSGYHRDGTFSGGPLWQPASFGPTVEFDGNNDWISMGNCLNLGLDDITVLVLVRYSTDQPEEYQGDHIGAIAGKGYLGPDSGYGLSVSTGNKIYWQVRNQSTVFSVGSDGALNDGQWHVVTAVCDRDSATGVRLYIDGVRQSATANPTSIAGLNLTSPAAFAIGSRQDSNLAWTWDFLGRVGAVYVWKRVLTETEIGQLYREPFALVAHRRTAAAFAVPPGAIIDLAGVASGISWASASLQAVRSLSGSATAHTAAVGVLRRARPTMRQDESPWRREVLGNGMTANAFKLGTMLTRGWFWVRRGGCAALYRGGSLREVDLSRIVHVAGAESREIPLPTSLSHPAGSTHCYLLRRFNDCGHQERTTTAAVTLRIEPDGQPAPPTPNGIFDLKGEQIGGSRLRLSWFYSPLDQETMPQEFNIYWDSATGQVDLEDPIATIPYQGCRFYQYETASLDVGLYRFVVRSCGADSVEGLSSAMVTCPVIALGAEMPAILRSQVL